MDNVTHTLAGLLLADGFLAVEGHRAQPRAPLEGSPACKQFRSAVFATSVLASSFPDLDFLYAGITGGKLGYLLHHRGHTHTLAAVLPMAAVCAALGMAWVLFLARIRGEAGVPKQDRWWVLSKLWLVGSLAVSLHIAMDYLNNYGVHPFWPVDDRWFYGDTIFIVDPWLIIAWCGVAFAAVESRVSKAILLIIAAGIALLAWNFDQVPKTLALALTLAAACWLWFARSWSPKQRWWAAALATLVVYGGLALARSAVRARILATSELDKKARILDVVFTPAPADPLCWSVIVVARTAKTYLLRKALVAPWPALGGVERCRRSTMGGAAPLARVPEVLEAQAERRGQLSWLGQFEAPIVELREFDERDCRAAAFLRFARAPFWTRWRGAEVMGDLRYDRSAGLGFAGVELGPSRPCPRFVPPWQPPREGLLE